MNREASIHYIAREKVKGVPHHAKAGNINSAMLLEAPGQAKPLQLRTKVLQGHAVGTFL